MKNKPAVVDMKVRGTCVTRNGNYVVSRMTATEDADACLVSVGFVSKKLHRSLHSGAVIDSNDLDGFCEAWLKARGILGSSLNAGAGMHQDVLDELLKAKEAIRKASSMLAH